ncbi:hypothetical protein BDW71DRAFT_206256 [Aspergillus fruticulosus]
MSETIRAGHHYRMRFKKASPEKVEALLYDPRTNINLGDSARNTPLFYVGGQLAEAPLGDMVIADLQMGIPETAALSQEEREAQCMAELLIGHGADPHAVNVDGCTALFFAVRFQRRGLAVVLQQHGLTLNMSEIEMLENSSSSQHSGHETNWPDPDMDLTQGDLRNRIREQWKKIMHEDHRLHEPDNETDLANMDPFILACHTGVWPTNLDDLSLQAPLGSPRDMALHKVGLSHQQLSSCSHEWQRIFGAEGIFGPFLDDIEEAYWMKRITETPMNAPTLGRRFPGMNK